MIRQRVSLAVAGAVVASTAMTVGMTTPASAAPTIYDPTFVPAAGDLSGAGSDTSEIALDFLSKGTNGIEGFNADKTTGRIASFAAGTDPTTVVLKAGAAAITRPNGSGAGKGLLYGSGNNTNLDFARSSSTLSAAEITASLRQSPFAVDGLKLAVSSVTSNAPATISDEDLVKIYKGQITTWNQLTGNSAGSTATIKPLIPQAGSGTRSFFTAQLKSKNGGSDVTLGAAVAETQEHSDADIKSNPNAIAPFSTGRAKSTSTVKMLAGFSAQRALYNVVRQGDLGGTKAALIESAFGTSGYLCSEAAKPLIEAAGFDQLASTANGGVCGVFGQEDITNFKTSNSSAAATTTKLAAAAQNGKSVKLTATVASASGLPSGKVVFLEGTTKVGQATVISGTATLTLPGATLGSHTYSAAFNPSNAAVFTASASAATSASVLKTSAIKVSTVSKAFGSVGKLPVSVTSDGAAATGTVTIRATGLNATGTLAKGAASIAVPATLAAGSRTVTVTYSGSADTSSSVATGKLTVAKGKTSITLKLSKTKIKASKKGKATVTVKISGSAVKAAGKVTLKAGSKTIGSGTVKNGKATITLKKLKKGNYKVKATFSGTANYGASTSKAVTLKVTK